MEIEQVYGLPADAPEGTRIIKIRLLAASGLLKKDIFGLRSVRAWDISGIYSFGIISIYMYVVGIFKTL